MATVDISIVMFRNKKVINLQKEAKKILEDAKSQAERIIFE
ncbi:hypothetical protein [Brachyspira catarrhinii]|nr:hypothetical protein [Brachyspira catarrhinii]